MASIITGASRGIGLAVAEQLARTLPSSVPAVLVGRDEPSLRAAAERVRAAGAADVRVVAGDVRDFDTAERAFQAAGDDGAGFVVLSAGTGSAGPLADFQNSEYEDAMCVNARGVFSFLRQAAAERHRGTLKGCCVMSSVAAVKPLPYDAVYSASKSAASALAASFHGELASETR